MEPVAHDVEELKRILADVGRTAFELAYIEYCSALLAEERTALAAEERKAA